VACHYELLAQHVPAAKSEAYNQRHYDALLADLRAPCALSVFSVLLSIGGLLLAHTGQ
jgi:hypothetical protein